MIAHGMGPGGMGIAMVDSCVGVPTQHAPTSTAVQVICCNGLEACGSTLRASHTNTKQANSHHK